MVADAEYLDVVAGAGKQVISSDEFIAAARNAEPAAEFADPDDVGVVLFTSGTTSRPKAVELTHNNLTSYITGTVEFDGAEPAPVAITLRAELMVRESTVGTTAAPDHRS